MSNVCRVNTIAMDTKLTLSFDAGVADRAMSFAEANNISLSRLIEFMLSKVTDERYRSLDELPVSDRIQLVAEGEVTYVRKDAADSDVKKDHLVSRRRRLRDSRRGAEDAELDGRAAFLCVLFATA